MHPLEVVLQRYKDTAGYDRQLNQCAWLVFDPFIVFSYMND